MKEAPKTCPQCGAPLPHDAPKGLCPRCAFERVLQGLPPPIGRTFGDYQLLEKIARGGMGYVYKARQVSRDRLVALKMIRAGILATREECRRFQIEAQTAARLSHPNIVPIYEVGEHQERQYFSMELIEGESLARQLQRFRQHPPAAARLVCQVAQAVHYAHQQGVIHRDLKPENIVVDREGQPHLTDFGLAKVIKPTAAPEQATQLTKTGAIMGTPAYMAPELAAGGSKRATPASDIYSLGAVLYALLTGQPPFTADQPRAVLNKVQHEEPTPPSRFNPLVDLSLERICLKCLEKDPGRRYATAEDLAKELARYLEGGAGPASRISPAN